MKRTYIRVSTQKKCVLLILVGKHTIDESAEILGVPHAKVNQWMHRYGKQVLRSMAI